MALVALLVVTLHHMVHGGLRARSFQPHRIKELECSLDTKLIEQQRLIFVLSQRQVLVLNVEVHEDRSGREVSAVDQFDGIQQQRRGF